MAISVQVTSMVFTGTAILNEVFGYFQAPSTVWITDIQITAQQRPVGGNVVITLVDANGASLGVAGTLASGSQSQNTRLAARLVVSPNQVIQAKITSVDSGVAGYLTVNLIGATAQSNCAPVSASLGPVGPQGPAGPAGAAGGRGLRGQQGIRGLKGDKGDTGDTGAQGPTGPTGPMGTSTCLYAMLQVSTGSPPSIPNAADTPVIFATALANDLLAWDVSQPARLTVPSGIPKVRLTGGVRWLDSVAGNRKVRIRSNPGGLYGANAIWAADERPSDAQGDCTVSTGIIPVTAGMYFELVATQDSGGALGLRNTNGNFFCMEMFL